jgi:Zn-dependent M28 family amino/carboxypeptidase
MNRHKAGDRILLIGAHYDTVKNSVGVDDNGSGVAALIELSRLCSSHIGKFNVTLYFVAFDMQEQGILGSLAFVNQYLIPEEISGKKAKFVGAYIMDMVMNFDVRPRSQSLPLDIFTVTVF